MNDRLRQLTDAMIERGIESLLVTDPKHIYYLTGFASDPHERFLGLLLSLEEEPLLVVPALDEEAARSVSSVTNITTHQDTDNPFKLLKRGAAHSSGTFGIEKSHMTVSRYEQLKQFVPASSYTDIGAILQAMRVRKSADEVAVMKKAIRIVEDTLRAGLAKVRIGVSEAELVAELEYAMKKLGADGPSFATMVLSGPNTALPHGVPGNRQLQAGDLLMFDLGVFAGGYASDITRTFAVGEISEEASAIYQSVLAANEAGIRAVKPGVTFGSVDKAAREVIEEAGYGPAFLHRLGHGLGLDIHEYPSVHGMNEDLLQPGNVFTIEPGVYVRGVGGVRIEDDVLVTDNGVEVLTTFPKELTVVG